MDSSEFDTVFTNETSLEQILHIGKYFSIERVKIQHRWEIRKSINENEKTNPVCKESLKREFEIGSQLQHPNICSYYRLSKDKSYLNREFIDGLSWIEFFKAYPNEKSKIEKYIIQLLDAIHYMHSNGIYHMDLKSENILISHELKILKIIDFGHALFHNDTLWRGGTKREQKPEKLISAESDWNSFFSLFNEIEDKISSRIAQKIKKVHLEFLKNNNRIDFQLSKDIFESQLIRNIPFKVIGLLIAAIFLFSILFRFSFTNDNLKIRVNNKSQNYRIQTKKDDSANKKIVDTIKQLSMIRKTKNEATIAHKDSIFLVKKANEFGPELEMKLKHISSKSKLEVFDSLVKAYNFKFESFYLIQNLDSNQIEIAKKIYIFDMSKSINKYVHLLN